jgi:putative transposase
MKQNRKLSKSISDASWSSFFQMLEYKAARAGILFRKVVPQGTSQRCFSCGKDVIKSLAVRTHCCSYCGLKIDRDYNASLNIRQRGIDSLLLPLEWRKVTPVEIVPLPIAAKGDSQARSLKQEAIGFNRW